MQTLYMLEDATRALLVRPDVLLLIAVLLAATVIDVRSYRIPNALTMPAMLAGVFAHTLASAHHWTGLAAALGGLVAPVIILIPLHALRLLGAGDVKLLAAVGAFIGAPDIILAILFVLAAGGFVAVAAAMYRKVLLRALGNIYTVTAVAATAVTAGINPVRAASAGFASAGRIPYAISITLGTLVFLVLRQVLS